MRTIGNQAPAASERAAMLAQDGFFVWPELVPDDVVDTHIAAHQSWLDRRGRYTPQAWSEMTREQQVRTFVRDYDWHERSETALDLFYRPELIAFLRQLFGCEPVMRAPQTGERQRGSSLHTDSGVIDPPGAEIRVWIALEDIDPASGPVYMVAGTHHLIADLRQRLVDEQPERISAFIAAAEAHNPAAPTPAAFIALGEAITAAWQREIRARRLVYTVPRLYKGDAIVFRTDVAHGTMPCADQTLTRRSSLAFFMARDAAWKDWPACALNSSKVTSDSWRIANNERGLYVADWLVL